MCLEGVSEVYGQILKCDYNRKWLKEQSNKRQVDESQSFAVWRPQILQPSPMDVQISPHWIHGTYSQWNMYRIIGKHRLLFNGSLMTIGENNLPLWTLPANMDYLLSRHWGNQWLWSSSIQESLMADEISKVMTCVWQYTFLTWGSNVTG